MYDLRSYRDNSLSERVRLDKDNYFMSEINNMNFLMALVKEEYIYTGVQLDTLISDLAFLLATEYNRG
tara:strand:- start:117 stop:320 length:204 start_codon:yes stop_codon:yes gene_type:complete